jgi:hypothetical protein
MIKSLAARLEVRPTVFSDFASQWTPADATPQPAGFFGIDK